MAKTKQDWYNGKGPMGHYAEMCEDRGHKLISLSGVEDGSGKVAKGSITFFCNNCQSEVTTTVASYVSPSSSKSTSKGCKFCKIILAKAREAAKNATRPTSKNRSRRRVWSKHSPFKTREAIIQHLRSEENPHNLRMLELMSRGSPPLQPGSDPKNIHTLVETHHIIPCHDGGEERVYN